MIEIRTTTGDILAQLDTTTLCDADFSGGTLREANLSGCDLSRSKFHGANLERAQLSRAKLQEADLSHADLREAILTEADLTGADLSWASLAPCEMRGANLCGTNLTNADLHGARLHDAKYDRRTLWPSGFDPVAHGCVVAHVDGQEMSEAAARELLREGRTEEALVLLQALLTHAPRDPRLHHLAGLAFARKDDADYALKHFLFSLSIEPDDPSTRYDTAVLYGRLGLPTQAVEHLRVAVHLAPNNDRISKLLAEMRGRAQH